MIEVQYLMLPLASRHQGREQQSKTFNSLPTAIAFAKSVENDQYKTFVVVSIDGKLLRIESRSFSNTVEIGILQPSN